MGIGAAVLGAGALGAVGSVASGAIGAGASEQAASEQEQAATSAQQLQAAEFAQTEASLAPYNFSGQDANLTLQRLTGASSGNVLTSPLAAPFKPTMNQLVKTPGYQFALQQGEFGIQNSIAPSGYGTGQIGNRPAGSGPGIKGEAQYAQGLASQTWAQQAQNYYQGNLQAYNMLMSQNQLGENAAATTGQQGLTSAANQGNALIGGAAAGAAGTIGAANSLTGAIGGVSSAGTNTALMLALNSSGFFGPSIPGSGDINIAG